MTQKGHSATEVLGQLDTEIRKDFETHQRILSFDEYLALLSQNPEQQLRGSAQYVRDMLNFFGKTRLKRQGEEIDRYQLFDFPVDGIAPKVVGHERVQNSVFRSLSSYARQGLNNRLILLHGPNGSAKTSLIHAVMGGMEKYSKLPEGAVYTYNWIFPLEKTAKGSIGITQTSPIRDFKESYARLPEEEVSARIPNDLRDHPFLLIPRERRKKTLESLVGKEKATALWSSMPVYLTEGDLNPRCKMIFQALLTAYNGNLRRVLAHVQVERFDYSRRYRQGLSSIEPQMHVDAQFQQLTLNKSVSSLPPALQNLNLFTLTGDLIDSNRGIVEFADLLKRPVDAFKYLLVACETGAVNVGPVQVNLDVVMLGSTNELQLDAFKEFPDFTSFKGRIELIRVPYLLEVSQEKEIYSLFLNRLSGEKHVAPHVAQILARWAVLTRLKKPHGTYYSAQVSTLISQLSPMEKSKLYDTGELPAHYTPEEKKLVRGALQQIRDEYNHVPFYEGRVGASAREIKALLFEASQNTDYACLSALAVLHELEDLVKQVSEHEFLREEAKDGYHDAAGFIELAREEYLGELDREIRESLGLYDTGQWEGFIQRYVQHISLVLKKEKFLNPITKKAEDPDFSLIREFEKIVEAPEAEEKLTAFRQNVLSTLGAWSLDHKSQPVSYAEVFPEFKKKIEKHYYESHKTVLQQMHQALQLYDKDEDDPNSESGKQIRDTLRNMKTQLGYCESCAKEAIYFLMKNRY